MAISTALATVISFFFATVVTAEEMTCFGTRENTLKAVSAIIDQYECTNQPSVSSCREAVAVGAALSGVAATKAVRSALRVNLQSMCTKKTVWSPHLLQLLMRPEYAEALPKTCPIDAQRLNSAYGNYLNDLDKGLDEDLAERRQGIDAARKRLDTRVRADNLAKTVSKLESELKRNPEKIMGPKYVSTDRAGAPKPLDAEAQKAVQDKIQNIREFLKDYGNKSGLELERYMAEKGHEIVKGLASNQFVGALLTENHPSELTEILKKLDAADTAERIRILNSVEHRFPALKDYAQTVRSYGHFQLEVSEFKRTSLQARSARFSSVDDVFAKYAAVKTPPNIEASISRRTAQSFRALHTSVSQSLRRHAGKGAALMKRYGARTIATKALVFLGSAPVFAADMAISPTDTACADFRFSRHATKSAGGCEIVDEIGPNTREFLMSAEDDEIFKELKSSPKFCESLQRYSARSSYLGWRAQCTTEGFKLKSLKSKTYLTYDFKTREDGTIRIAERIEARSRSVNVRFGENETFLEDKEHPEIYEELQAMNLAIAHGQGCCNSYIDMDKDLCARLGVSSNPRRSNTVAPASGGSTGSASGEK